ncbi:hypothetical protein AN644_05045 [Candidatus Epulonipiscium fishelsonii]|nr:hypothetical protein AN644_05045 [Epulopiscium sp. SCG-C06WGA-EpuloA1]
MGGYLGVTTRTIQNYCKNGTLDEVVTVSGRRTITRQSLINYLERQGMIDINTDDRIDVIYCRVSTKKQQETGDLQRQLDSVLCYCALQNPKDVEIFKEIGSGLNDNRKQLNKLLQLTMDGKVKRIFISYKDRLTRFGFNYIEAICKRFNTKIVIVSTEVIQKSMEEELAEDLCAIIHSFSGKLYGMRGRVKKYAIKELGGE